MKKKAYTTNIFEQWDVGIVGWLVCDRPDLLALSTMHDLIKGTQNYNTHEGRNIQCFLLPGVF